jgi:hypothetical protein
LVKHAENPTPEPPPPSDVSDLVVIGTALTIAAVLAARLGEALSLSDLLAILGVLVSLRREPPAT